MNAHVVSSLTFERGGRALDYADVAIIALPHGTPTDPAQWARTIFSMRTSPAWVRAALGLRQLVVPLMGIARSPRNTFAVDEVSSNEALICASERHLDFRCAVGVDEEAGLVTVTTAVELHGLRGLLYFAPVRLAHPIVVHSMLTRAARVLTPS